MNPTLYALCQKPAIGAALWISGLCAFPPLLNSTAVILDKPGTILSTEFEVPVSKNYFMYLNHTFKSNEERLKDTLVGARYDVPCYGKDAKAVEDFPAEKQVDLGRPVQLHITIRKLPEKSVVIDKLFASICPAGHDGNTRKSQIIGLVELQQGAYLVEVKNEVARPDFSEIKSAFMIAGGGVK
jgi:hypothetical protein